MPLFFKDYPLYLDDKIKTIATGPLGKTIKHDKHELWNQDSYDYDFRYIDNNFEIAFTQNGFHSKYEDSTFKERYIIYYKGKLVYPDRYKEKPVWLDKFNSIYDSTLIAIKKRNEEIEKERKIVERKNKVENKLYHLFRLTYPRNFKTDKISVEHFERHCYSYTSTYDGDEDIITYHGRITLATGDVVYDSKEKIHRPGAWEDYVCLLADQLLLLDKEKAEERQRQSDLDRQRKQEEEQKIYKRNHAAIDDSKLFR